MSELIAFVVGVILGITLTLHVARRYQHREGFVADAIRRALGK